MFDRFTPKTQSLFDTARMYAKVDRSGSIQVVHVLRAMLSDKDMLANQILTGLLEPAAVAAFDEDLRGMAALIPQIPGPIEPGYSEEIKKAMDDACKATEEAGVKAIGTEEILLALAGGPMHEFFEKYGVTPDKVLDMIRAISEEQLQNTSQLTGRARADIGLLLMVDEGLTAQHLGRLMDAMTLLRGVVDARVLQFKAKEAKGHQGPTLIG